MERFDRQRRSDRLYRRSEEHTSELQSPVHLHSFPTRRSSDLTYSYTVAARDAAGNVSPDSASVSVTTGIAADTTPPTTPSGLTATVAGSSGANLSWSASTDNVGVTGYIVDRKSTRLNSSHPSIYTLSLHDALPI